MGTKREKNHRLPTGKISTDYRHEPTKATNAITDQKCNNIFMAYIETKILSKTVFKPTVWKHYIL